MVQLQSSVARGMKTIICRPSVTIETGWWLVLGCGINKHGSFSVKGESCQPGSHPFFLHFYCTKFILKWKKTALKINTALLCIRLYAVLKLGGLGVLWDAVIVREESKVVLSSEVLISQYLQSGHY